MKPSSCRSCGYDRCDLRRRVLGNGSVQIVYQCLNCGRSASNPLSHALIPNSNQLLAWDESIAADYENQREQFREEAREEWFSDHDQYLRSPKWKEKRRLVLDRCGGVCEGCRSAGATQVHHLSYENWQDELLWELVAVCDACHHKAHTKRITPGQQLGVSQSRPIISKGAQ